MRTGSSAAAWSLTRAASLNRSLPKTQKWVELVERIAGPDITGDAATASSYIEAIAAETLAAARRTLENAKRDPGVLYAFYLLTKLVWASRSPDWENTLATYGISLGTNSTVFDLTVELHSAIDRHLSPSGATDLSEMAQQSLGEALISLAGSSTIGLFGGDETEVRNAIRPLSTEKGFAELGQRFFAVFASRFLNFYLSRATAATLGSPRLRNLEDIAEFNQELRLHCVQSARILRDFCGGWYSKKAYERGIDLRSTSRFFGVAIDKLRSEFEQQGSEV